MGTSNAIGHPKNNKSAPLASEEVVRDDEGEDISSSTTTAKTKTTVNRTIASNDVEYLAKREADIAKWVVAGRGRARRRDVTPVVTLDDVEREMG